MSRRAPYGATSYTYRSQAGREGYVEILEYVPETRTYAIRARIPGLDWSIETHGPQAFVWPMGADVSAVVTPFTIPVDEEEAQRMATLHRAGLTRGRVQFALNRYGLSMPLKMNDPHVREALQLVAAMLALAGRADMTEPLWLDSGS